MVPCRRADDSSKPFPLKSVSPKKPDASAKKPNYFHIGLSATPPFVRLDKPRPALT